MSVQFVDSLPEPGTRGRKPANRGPHYETAKALRANRGKWGIVDIGTSATTTIAKGTLVDFRPAGAYEATSRTIDGKRVMFARYVGKRGTK